MDGHGNTRAGYTLFDYPEDSSSRDEFPGDFSSVSRKAAIAVLEVQRSVSSPMRLLFDNSRAAALSERSKKSSGIRTSVRP